MNAVFISFKDLIFNAFFGETIPTDIPSNIIQWTYNLSWLCVAGIFLLVFCLILFGVWLVANALIVHKKKKNAVHYYYHKDR